MMNKNKMKKLCAFVVALIIMSFCLSACGGNDLTGTWYRVCADPSSASDNVTFQSDGTFVSDVAGEYVVDGDTVRMSFMGMTTVNFELAEYDGTDALVEQGYEIPYWCRTVEAAEQAYNDAMGIQ